MVSIAVPVVKAESAISPMESRKSDQLKTSRHQRPIYADESNDSYFHIYTAGPIISGCLPN